MKPIEIWADWHFLSGPQIVGVLTVSSVRGKEMFSFKYDDSWLKGKFKFEIDPQLKLYQGHYYPVEGFENFGIFLDSSPDRWGKTLMQRREALIAQSEKRKARQLFSSDYLLGVYDLNRMGGLRFKVDGVFQNDNRENAAPPWTSIRELEAASLAFEKATSDDPKLSKWLKMLFVPGSSLGGARPKASIVDSNGDLWIAKFPSKDDDKDVGAWEAVVHELAKKCGINIPQAKAEKFGKKYHTFLVKRFDRLPKKKRVHFASAMTLLERKDGDNYKSGTSYLELVDFILSNGTPSKVNRDLEELWRRIVFSIAVSNTDDHLRNHGFLLTEEGWELSPAYDLNANELADGLSLNISWESHALDYDLAKSVASYFRVSPVKASEIIKTTRKEVAGWRKYALKYGISRSEQERMKEAFRI